MINAKDKTQHFYNVNLDNKNLGCDLNELKHPFQMGVAEKEGRQECRRNIDHEVAQ